MYSVYVDKSLRKSISGGGNILSYAQYKVGQTEVLVGCRPYKLTKKFYKSVDGWISVTGRFVHYPKGTNYQWFPWNEAWHCSPTTLFGVVRTLDMWIRHLKLKKIYIHCDGGTHRAPTVFGAYLKFCREKDCEEIVKKVKLVNRDNLSDPLEYIGIHLNDHPEDHLFLKYTAVRQLDELDSICSDVKKTVEGRF